MAEQLKLYYPVKPYSLNQGFGKCTVSAACNFYKELGMLGHNGEDLWAPDGRRS